MSDTDLLKSLNNMAPAERHKRLLALKQQANKDAERPNLLVFADEIASPNFLRRPTGIAQIDIDLGGGWPAGIRRTRVRPRASRAVSARRRWP